jgi:uncharacterized membrane protein
MKNRFYIFIIVIFFMTPFIATALQQTVGELTASIDPGNSTTLEYSIRNEESSPITVKFNITEGPLSDYVIYEHQLTFEPNTLTPIKISVSIPANYTGPSQLTGTIYALKEGSPDGQVQLNIQLGKNIKINVNRHSSLYYFEIAFMAIAIIVAIVLIQKKNPRRETQKNE